MSLCRNNGEDSDVYVIGDIADPEGTYRCYTCLAAGEPSGWFDLEGTVLHLVGHLRRGEKVPDRAFECLLREMRTGGIGVQQVGVEPTPSWSKATRPTS